MRIRTPAELGALIRDYRIKRKLDQKTLAKKVGVGREWIIEVEKGKPRAEIGLVLRTIDALGIRLVTETERIGGDSTVDVDTIVEAARTKKTK